jgi:type IV pilus assembly protein PilY1
MSRRITILKWLLGFAAAGFFLVSHAALDMSQVPLLTQTGSVAPNLLFILDDSGSMNAQYLYKYGGTGGGYGMPGPGNGTGQTKANCSGTLNVSTTCSYTPPPITFSTTATPATWSSSSSYSQNTFVKATINGVDWVYQCMLANGCDAGNDPRVDPPTPAAWTTNGYNQGAVVTYTNGHVYQCISSSNCSSSRVPGSSSRWQDMGLLADYLRNEAAQWDNGVTLASYLGAVKGSGRFWEVSPDVNRITYDPRIRYKTRLTGVDSTTTTTAATPSTTTSFYVFFYGSGGSVTPKSQTWDGTNTYGDPATYGSYFAPYTASNQGTNPDSALASGATPGLSYPQCVGPCPGVPATVSKTLATDQFPKFAGRTECVNTYCTLAEEQQNYATWKKFYSNRMDMAKSGIGYAFQNVNSGLRLGWAMISDLDTYTDLGTQGSGVSALNQTNKAAYYTWLYSRKPSSDTPLRESLIAAGMYFSRADNKGPWAATPDPTSKTLSSLYTSTTSPGDNSPAHASCRRSYAMMLTDGYYNGTDPGRNDTDYTAITQIKGTSSAGSTLTFDYNGRTLPYAQSSSTGTMADIAMKYWITDLRPDLTNNVPTSVSNESFWQNMGFYGVTLGIDGTLAQTKATLDAIKSGSQTWPSPPSAGDNPTTVDDLWHATVNARGSMLNAKNADELSVGIEGMLAEINSVESSQAGVAASTAALSLSTTSRKYIPTYNTGTWVGNVLSSTLDSTTGNDTCTKWRIAGTWKLDPTDGKYHWFVGNKRDGTPDLAPDLAPFIGTATTCSGATTSVTFNGIASASTRAIYAWNSSSYGNFDASNSYAKSATTGVAAKNGTTADASLIDYLRGDQSNEDLVDASGRIVTNKLYRYRPYVLGDIVNSKPTFVKGVLNMQYDKLPSGTLGQSTYADFVSKKAARSEGVLFVGANDGMVHGFAENDGREVFAFVPKAVMPAMYLIASRGYDHQYFVDGDTSEVDACLSGGSGCTTWSNLLLGTAGAGGKTVYALDVSDPTNMSAKSIKWEITPTDITNSSGATASTKFANMGNNLSNMQTGVTTGGQWVAIFGNGYNGGDGTNASLFVVDLDTGAFIQELTVPKSGGDNGLGGVAVVRNSSKQIIGAYAGDLQGRMWKFDLSNSNSTNWKVDFGVDPLFAAGSTQPIVAAPTVIDLADPNVWADRVDTAPKIGYMVSFGTGKLFEANDVKTTSQQTMYGVWDDKLFGASPTKTNAARVTSSNLVARTISDTSQLVITDTSKRGWYANFTKSGERLIYSMLTTQYHNLTATLLSPAGVTADACSAGSQGTSTPYILDALWVTVAPPTPTTQPDPLCISANCPTPPPPCIGPGCKAPCGGSAWTCTAASGGEPVLVATDQTCANGAPLTKLLYSRSQTCTATCKDGTILDSSTGSSSTYTINQCPAFNLSQPGPVKRTWRQLFMR